MKKVLIFTLSVIFVSLLIVGGFAAYFGFIPSLSDSFVKRVDLGIENDPQLNLDLMKKVGLEYNISASDLPTNKDLIYEGTLEVDTTLTSEEVTSQLNTVRTESTKIPFSNVQVRFNNDGTAEASFNLNIETTVQAARELGYTEEEIEKGKKYLGVLGKEVYIYTKGEFFMDDNQLTVMPQVFRIQNFNIPNEITKMVADIGSRAIEDRLNQIPNLNIESLKQEGSKVQFVGTIPKSVRVEK